MKDKEKQILAITQDLSDCLQYDIEDSNIVETYDTACNLVNKGWVKLPEDSVVLSREDMKKYAKDCIAGQETGLDIINALIARAERYKEKAKQSSKETAEKFVKGLIDKLKDNANADNVDFFVEVKKMANDLAKQFGVEIKE